MTSLTPSFRRAVAITIACAVLGLSATACSAIPTASHAGAGASSAASAHASDSASDQGADSAGGDDGSAGTNTGLCADATGEGFDFGSDDSDISKTLQTWDKMADDSPADIRDDVTAVDKVMHKVSKGDASAADDAFATHLTAVATWVADNCNL